MRGLVSVISNAIERKMTDASALTWQRLLGEDTNKAGVPVNLGSGLRNSVVLACGRVISEGCAQVPWGAYRELDEGGNEVAKNIPLHKMLRRRPNDWMTSFELRETLTLHAVLAQGGYAYKNKIDGITRELLPIMPQCVTKRQARDYTITYEVQDSAGKLIGTFGQDDMFTIHGPSWDGVNGMNMISQAREAIGLGIATEETHARFHANGAQVGGLISVKNRLGPDGKQRLKSSFQELHEGVNNKFRTLVLDLDATYSQIGMSGVDSQHLETRRFQIEEVCRFMRVLPLMVMQSDKTATFASYEQSLLAHVVHTLGPWVERWDQCTDRDLVEEYKDGSLYSKLRLQGLLRGDAKSRAEFYQILYNIGAMNPNEIRALEDMNPYKGGEKYRVPLNMADPAAASAAAGKLAKMFSDRFGLPAGLSETEFATSAVQFLRAL